MSDIPIPAPEWKPNDLRQTASQSNPIREHIVNLTSPQPAHRFANVSCSQCGRDFGPGDSGFSHCQDHRPTDGGPAFPGDSAQCGPWFGMSLRDYFATNAPSDEVQELQFRHLSRMAQESMTGMKYPEKPVYWDNDPAQIEFQIAEFEFKCAVNAAIRFKLADAMLKARTS